MLVHVLRRLWSTLTVAVGVAAVIFVLLHLSGDPVALLVPADAPPEVMRDTRRALGLDRPLPQQFFIYLSRAAAGDLGTSLRHNLPVAQLIRERLPRTILLAAAALALALVIAIPAGIVSALRRGTLVDRLAMVLAVAGQAVPIFWLALMLIWLFAVRLEWLPVFGSGTLLHLVLPAVSLSTIVLGRLARLVRSSMLEVLEQDYVRTARAKGLGETSVVWGHALKNAAIPIVTVVGLQLGPAPGRRRRHRDDLRLARRRRAGGRGRLQPRLPGRPGRDACHLADLRRRQPGRGPRLRGPQSEDPSRMRRPRVRPSVLAAGVVLAAVVLLAVCADWVAPARPNEQDITARLRPPALAGGTWSRPLGTDELGRDVLSRLLYGARVSLAVGLWRWRSRAPLGVVVGLVSGFFGGWIDAR